MYTPVNIYIYIYIMCIHIYIHIYIYIFVHVHILYTPFMLFMRFCRPLIPPICLSIRGSRHFPIWSNFSKVRCIFTVCGELSSEFTFEKFYLRHCLLRVAGHLRRERMREREAKVSEARVEGGRERERERER